jgi:hypothetical protein
MQSVVVMVVVTVVVVVMAVGRVGLRCLRNILGSRRLVLPGVPGI